MVEVRLVRPVQNRWIASGAKGLFQECQVSHLDPGMRHKKVTSLPGSQPHRHPVRNACPAEHQILIFSRQTIDRCNVVAESSLAVVH